MGCKKCNDMKDWKERYCNAHEEMSKIKYAQGYADGHYSAPIIPKVKTANGLTTFCANYIKWTNGHLERTNNMGVPVKKKIPKFNIFSGKLEQLDGGIEWRKGTGSKGTSDLKGHIVTPNHKYGLPVYIEIKIKDKQSEDQKEYERKINSTGGLYAVVHNPDEFFSFIDYVMGL